MTEIDAFMMKVSPEPNTGCWLWLGAPGGGRPPHYGRFYYVDHGCYAHRRAYELFCGEIPKGMLVTHRCDVKACVNPEHLKLGTFASNLKDAWARGRQPSRPAWNHGLPRAAWYGRRKREL
jgi:hypothetical protein